MKIHKNNKIKYTLKTLAVLAFLTIFVPLNKAAADYPGYVTPYNSTYWNNSAQNPAYVAPPSYFGNNGYGNGNGNNSGNLYSNSTNPNGQVLGAETSKDDSGKDLASNAIYGSNSFLPTGLLQWILVAIFILIIVILVRKVLKGREKYHAAPMKHD